MKIFEAQVLVAARLKSVPLINYLKQKLKFRILRNKLKLAWYLEKNPEKKAEFQIKLEKLELEEIKLYTIYQETKKRNSIRISREKENMTSDDEKSYKTIMTRFDKKIEEFEKKIKAEEDKYKKIVLKYNPK